MRRVDITRDLIAQALRLREDLEPVRRELDRDPDALMAKAFSDADPGLRPRAIVGVTEGVDAEDVSRFDEATMEQRRQLFEAGKRAFEKVSQDGEAAVLEPDEALGLEAIVRFSGRPAILVRNGSFETPAPPWEKLAEYRDGIVEVARSVGRIHANLPGVPYLGTGFIVADDVLMTNCHVARLFAERAGGSWKISEGRQPTVDFADNPDADPPDEFAIEAVIGIHERLDLALLRLASDGGGVEKPQPLTLMSEAPDPSETRQVYVVGYPAPDPRNDPAVMRQIFGDIYFVKRLQPGALVAPSVGPVIAEAPCSLQTQSEDVIYHDASTLGGNSGSCAIDLETNQVLGLHFAGLYTKYNQGVALWTLTEDPLLVGAQVNFD